MDDELSALLTLSGQTALVTGAATGIGESIAKVLARAGAHVVVADIDDEGARRVAAETGGAWRHLDVTDAAACASGIAEIAGSEGLHILVNNAGSYHESGSILDQSHESWRRAIEINLASLFNCSKPAAQHLATQATGGSIVNISSVDGLLPCLGTGYDTAKAGAIHFTRSLAVDLAPHNIRVNGVAPGAVPVPTLMKKRSGELPPVWPKETSRTGLMGPLMRQRSANIPLGRQGAPEEIAHAVLFLCSGLASYVTGQTLAVDGGWTLV